MADIRSAIFVGRGALVERCAELWRSRGNRVVLRVEEGVPALVPLHDVLFLIGVPDEVLGAWPVSPRGRVVAYQDALLPAHAGWHATSWAILQGESEHGVTWYTPDAAGPLPLKQAAFPVAPDETAFSLDAKCFDAALASFSELAADLEAGRAAVLPARRAAASFHTRSQRPPAACFLDFSRPARELHAQARALSFGGKPNPLGLPKLWLGDAALAVREVAVAPAAPAAAPGTLLALDAAGLTVATGEGAVALRGVAHFSGQPVALIPFAGARGWAVGTVLPALDTSQAAAFSALHEELAPHEPYWVAHSAACVPCPLPWSGAQRSQASSPLQLATDGTGLQGEDLLAANAAFFLKLADVEEGAFGLRARLPAGAEAWAAAQMPVSLAADDASFAVFAERFKAACAEARAHRTLSRDLGLRYPELASVGTLDLPISFALGDAAGPVVGPALQVEAAPGSSGCTWRVDPSALGPDALGWLASLFNHFVDQLAANPAAPWRTVPLADAAKRAAWLGQLSDPPVALDVQADFGELVAASAQRAPEAVAVAMGGTAWTYRDLDRRSNQMAALLRARGVGPDVRVALFMERAPETMAALLGVLKAGGCYVPLDPAYPPERLAYMLDQAAPALVLAQPGLRGQLPATGVPVLDVDPALACLEGQPDAAQAGGAGPDHLAYLIYTSGSTGQPKGVAMTRRALRNLVAWQNTASTPGAGARTFQYASLNFDVSFQEVFSTWAAGGALVLVPEELRRDPMALLRLAASERIERWFMPYAALQQVAASAEAASLFPETLRDVVTAGEALRITPEIRRFFQRLPNCRLHNQYGPSETHVATAYLLPADPAAWPELPPIGRPIANTRLALLDAHGEPVPPGLPGELYIGGACLARGYHAREDLTAERFVERAWPGAAGGRFYRTGDLARLLPDGQVEFLGRRDDQVKIRGYRVELGEIEAVLSRHPAVAEAAVAVREHRGVKQLAAYAVVRDPAVGPAQLKEHLRAALPGFMVPAAVMLLERMPLTPSGKINRRALPEPVFARAAAAPPASGVARVLARVWEQVLGVDGIGADDNFFELGGDSLKLAQVQAALRTALQRDVPILELFRYTTLSALAAHLGGAGDESPVATPRRARAVRADEPIAVVGMAGRFPGADSVEQLWRNLCEARECITTFADDEVAGGVPPGAGAGGLAFIKARGVLERCEWFDAAFFGFGPREAALMDPQHRVFLECAWEALEHAGIDPARYRGLMGVYAAASLNTYLINNVLAQRAAAREFIGAFQVGGYQTLMGNDKDYVGTRVSYKLNLRGPGMTIQSGCSSSLVALCQACQALAAGACDAALAGGVSISFPQKRGYVFVEGSIASSDGHCRPFDANATGTVFGAGAGLVVLKRLSDAQADGDTVYAVIKGWALNNDGAMKAGFMAPSAEGQAEVIAMAHERAGVDPRTISYVETHGTGTPIGDPIEVSGLTRAFRLATADKGFCALGSVKANIGHLESAAGVTGLIKTVLALHHAKLPPLLHFERPNPLIGLPDTPFYASNQLAPWPSVGQPRRAGVSSFGVGGTNAHVVLEEAPPVAEGSAAATKPACLLPLSARTPTALPALASNLAAQLEPADGVPLPAAAYTLQTGRQRLEHRAFVVAANASEAAALLRAPLRPVKALPVPPVPVFLFPGQGSQHVDMARGIYEAEPLFRRHVDACTDILRPLLGFALTDVLYPDASRAEACQEQLKQTRFAQPALFTIEYAMAQWWQSLGVRPVAMIGHSAGEYVAACLQGIFSVEDALKVLVERARLMQELPPGSMLAVRMSEEEAQPWIGPHLALAAANAPQMSVISGPTEAVAALARELEAKGIGGKLLVTSHAFHSEMMDPALEPFRKAVEGVVRRVPDAPFLSSMEGRWIEPEEAASADYWVRQIRQPVRFSRTLRAAQQRPGAVFLECGPNQALTTLALQHDAPEQPVTAIPSLRHARESVTDYASLLRAVGRLWCAGQDVDWAQLYDGRPPRRAVLPGYPFERKAYWIEPPKDEADSVTAALPEVETEAAPEVAAPVGQAGATDPKAVVLHDVLDILQDLSGIDRATIVPERAFLEMGFDSLFLTQVSLAFQRKFLVKLTLRQMLDDLSSPAAIAAYIAANLPPPPTSAAPVPAPQSAAPASASQADQYSIAQAGPFAPEQQAATPSAPAAPSFVRHGPYAPVNKSAGDALTPQQQQHLDALIARYTAKTAKSKAYTKEHRPHFSDPRAVSGFRVTWKEMTYPVVAARSEGSKIWDLDGNEFLDVTMGFGTNLFGHNPAFIRTAIEKQLGIGLEIGPQSALAGGIAKAVCELVGMERATFCNTGSEAVVGAVRAARTVTGRNRIVYFAGDYHGVNDEALAKGQTLQGRLRTVPVAPGIPPESVSQVLVLPYGEASSLATIRAEAGTLAAVLVEPVQSRKPYLQPEAFLRELRAITEQTGVALIFDEVITGFRVHPGGAQAWFGVKADLATYGKIIGGGMPIGVIAGRRAYMDAFDGGHWEYGDSSVPEAGVTFFAGTFVRHPLAMAAAQAVVQHLREQGPELQRALNERTSCFVAAVNSFFEAEGVDVRIHNFGSLWYFSHGDAFRHFSLLFHYLRDQGIHIWEGRPCFLSTAHSDADIARLIEGFKAAIRGMRDGGFLPERIAAVAETGAFPLTEAQQEIWMASRLNPAANPAFNESCALTFRGALDREALAAALRQLVQRHEALRTTFDASGEAQTPQPTAEPPFLYEDFSALPPDERERQFAARVQEEVGQSFDLARAPLLRARLVRMEAERHVLLLTAHHIVCDGWSYDVMVRDLGTLYSKACRSERDERPPPAQFRDYAKRMAVYRAGTQAEADLAYWLKRLAAPPDAVALPVDRPRPPQRTFAGAMEIAPVEAGLLNAVKELGAKQRCTLFGTLLAVYAVLLHRLSGQQDVVVGIPAAGRQSMEDHALVGHCANLLPLRLRVEPAMTFAQVLAEAQRALLEAYEHQDLTFGALLKAMQLARDPQRPPLIQVTFNVDPAIHGLAFGALETEIVINPRTAFQFEHSLNIVAYADRLRMECNFNCALFEAATMQRWLGYYREIMRTVSAAPDTPVGAIPLQGEDERRRQLFDWNRTAVPYPSACIHTLFAQEAQAHPDRVAVSCAGCSLTYAEVDRAANRLAHRLAAHGVGPDVAVGLCVERSVQLPAALLGILKAGGAYLPLDPAHPLERLKLQVADAKPRAIVAQAGTAPAVAELGVPVVLLDSAEAEAGQDHAPDATAHRPSQLAYILYTSGSTGRPKGVLIEHRSVVRLVRGADYIDWRGDSCMLQHSPLAFDASTLEVWGPLLNGGRVAVLPAGPFSFDVLARALREERVTNLWLTASVFHRLVDEQPKVLASVRHVLAGGEALSAPRIVRLLKAVPGLCLTNGYGPTESTTFATTQAYTDPAAVDDPPLLGRPISNTQVYLLDDQLHLVPPGVPGELCIGGDGLARGYLNQPELTQRAFVPNPFPGTPGERLYRTGDLARYQTDGRIEFLGRRDSQVKIRGFRIEPGEIEAALAGFPGVQLCAVVVRSDAAGEKQLAGYLSIQSGQPAPTVESLRKHLRATLPDFMVPATFAVLPALPLTESGKVDRRALPDPAAHAVQASEVYVAPQAGVEQDVAAIWAQVLGVPKVGLKDDFFALGGHSLTALNLVQRMQDSGYTVEVPDLFRYPTVEGLVRVVKPAGSVAPGVAGTDMVVRLKDGKPGRTPLVLLPSDYGDLLIYTNLLPLLDTSLPVIGLRCTRLYEDDQGLASMKDLAALFVRKLREVQPEGPYQLAGYCFGGLVAIEMGRQLAAAGQVVSLLGVIDARPFSPRELRGERLLMLVQGALKARWSDWKRHLGARIAMQREGTIIDRMARQHPEKLDRRDLNRWILETRVLAGHQSTRYDGNMCFFYPEESQYQLYGDPTCGWLHLAERVELFKTTGSHLNMMKEPHVKLLARYLHRCIRMAEEKAR